MRIHFKNLGHAERYLKTCKRKLIEHLNPSENARIPSQRVRNAFCRGFGYRAYDELKQVLSFSSRELKPLPSEEDLLGAITKGFSLAFQTLSEYGPYWPTVDESIPRTLARAVVDEPHPEASVREQVTATPQGGRPAASLVGHVETAT